MSFLRVGHDLEGVAGTSTRPVELSLFIRWKQTVSRLIVAAHKPGALRGVRALVRVFNSSTLNLALKQVYKDSSVAIRG